ncbi:MAG: excinuclease ABC subunit UvrC [Candidatus Aminicenantes bacterium]|nr:excinuclease ABC subunit UvrC [Candidatus Aminicenantes bacterium]
MAGSELKRRLGELPDKPGIYFFKNAANEVIYIGKAGSLRDRVASYFQADADRKVRAIISETSDFDFLLTGSEVEAAFLESNTIRRYQPKHNLRLKDDKSFPYIKVTLAERYPGVYFSRRVEKDGSRYFGPYAPARRARQAVRLVNRFFGLRSCEEAVFRNRKRPCLEHELGFCSAPCVGRTSEKEYAASVRQALLFLEGRKRELLPALREKMNLAAERQEFEMAARWRDFIRAVEELSHKPRFISAGGEDKDIIGFSRRENRAAVHVFFMRRGKVSESEEVRLEAPPGVSEKALLGRFLRGFYHSSRPMPDIILLPFKPPGLNAFARGLSRRRGRTVRVLTPGKGANRRLLELAGRNAEKMLSARPPAQAPSVLAELQEALELPLLPRRIEGFDVSNTGGTEIVGSSVSFTDGEPDKNGYRRYKIKTVQGPNDVAGLKEIVGRRLARLKAEGPEVGWLPDLILVDGGPGQLRAARQALFELKLAGLPAAALAKKNEIVFTDRLKEGLTLPRSSAALKLLQRVRDEAHRFAVSFHRRRRGRASLGSFLDGVPGLGPKKKNVLLEEFRNPERIKKLTEAELARRVGIRAARALLEKFRSQEAENDRRRRH